MRFLITALPFFLVTVKPARGFSPILAASDSSSERFRTSRRNSGPRRFSPFLTDKNSALLRRRSICFCFFISLFTALVARGKIKRKAACGRANGERQEPCGRRQLPCAHGNRDDACGRDWMAGKCASFI